MIDKNQVFSKRIHHTDIFSTILGAANIEQPKNTYIDGKNLIPYIVDKKEGEPHDTLYWKNSTYQAIIHNDWKLMRSKYPFKQEFLYNLSNDPYELSNVAGNEFEIKQLLNNMLDKHVESMPKVKWPQSVYIPITTDRPITDYENGDELIYWPN
jgi:arylsulfatase A-like enzyme